MFSAMINDLLNKLVTERNIDFVQARQILDQTIDMIKEFPLDAASIVYENTGLVLDEFYELLE